MLTHYPLVMMVGTYGVPNWIGYADLSIYCCSTGAVRCCAGDELSLKRCCGADKVRFSRRARPSGHVGSRCCDMRLINYGDHPACPQNSSSVCEKPINRVEFFGQPTRSEMKQKYFPSVTVTFSTGKYHGCFRFLSCYPGHESRRENVYHTQSRRIDRERQTNSTAVRGLRWQRNDNGEINHVCG